MSVLFDNRQEAVNVTEALEKLAERVINGVLDSEGCDEDYEVSISFVDNQEIRSLNNQYRGIDSATDVLSFPMLEFDEILDEAEWMEEALEEDECFESEIDEAEVLEDPETEIALGDIVISMEKTVEQANEYGHSFERELAFLLVHGMLHLLGYDHENEEDEKSMFTRQDEILEELNIKR